MKTKNYFKKATLLLLVCSAQLIMAQVPNYVPTDGLVAYYPFTGNANDISGNGNNGTVNNAVLTVDRLGNANSAYDFNGTTSHISINNSICNFGVGNFTMSAWISKYDLTTVGAVIGKRNSPADGNMIILSSRPSYEISSGTGDYLSNSNIPVFNSLNTWFHIVLVRSGTNLKTYINGVLVNDYVSNTIQNINNSAITEIGARYQGSSIWNLWHGKIDEVGIWNRALTQQEITSIYNQIPSYNDTCNAVSGSLTQGLVGYWPFCGNANDDSGHGNNGTVNGATLTTDRFGNSNSAYHFNGVSNTISYNSTFVFNQNSDGALSFWFDNESILSNIYSTLFFSKTTLGESNRFNLYLQPLPDNLLRLTVDYRESNTNLHILNTYQPITNNIWNNLVISRALNVYTLYLNGILVGSVTDSTPNLPNEIGWLIGSNPNGFGAPIFYQGKIDDIGFWNRALTQSEVTQLYNQNQCFTNTTVTDTLVINVGQMGFNPVTYANNITIYPNPANTQVTISFNTIADLNGGSIKIINSLGQQVATTPINVTGTNTTMQLASWGGSGLYFVQIVNPQGQIVDIKKILLQ
jgi:hypothetical protein